MQPDAHFRQVFEFLDNQVKLPRHIIMFYEEPEDARMVIFRFLKNACESDALGVFVIPEREVLMTDFEHEKRFLEQEMQQNAGIDTSLYKENGLLQFLLIQAKH